MSEPYELSIEVVGRTKRARQLRIGEGESAYKRVVSKEVIKELGLKEGTVFGDPRALDQQIDEIEFSCAKEKAFAILARKACSYSMLQDALLEAGFPYKTVGRALVRVQELGYLDDEHYAHMFVTAKQGSGWGQRKICNELKRRGIAEEIIDGLFMSVFSAEEELEGALRLISSKPCESRKDREKLLRKLVAKGYSFPIAKQAVENRLSSFKENGY